jgi:hypothetical protein
LIDDYITIWIQVDETSKLQGKKKENVKFEWVIDIEITDSIGEWFSVITD